MAEHSLELSIGDVVQIGDYIVTVVDIENDQVTFRIEQNPEQELLTQTWSWTERPR